MSDGGVIKSYIQTLNSSPSIEHRPLFLHCGGQSLSVPSCTLIGFSFGVGERVGDGGIVYII